MPNNKKIIDELLSELINKLEDKQVIKIKKSILINKLKEMGISEDPTILFEELEPLLSKNRVTENWFIRYNLFTENLVIQPIPTWEVLEWAAEKRSSKFDETIREKLSSITFAEFEQLCVNLFGSLAWLQKVNSWFYEIRIFKHFCHKTE